MANTASSRAWPAQRRAALFACIPLLLGADAAMAQDGVSRAVVQPLPSLAAAELGAALRRLASNSRDFGALIDAGNASLALNDIDAAIGFFGRAQALREGDPRVKAGLASAYLRSDRAVEALQLFAEAERAGGASASFAADRGLAYDLVGDNAAAQAQYRLALARGTDPEVVRRLALSQAIAGDKAGFEATLLPQLQQRVLAAFRVRAFGLAILGEEGEAVSIAQAVMPRELSERVAPYLRYMPRLTRAQQAAAANLGSFPRAAQIGRDDPRLAQYSGSPPAPGTRTADARLAPAGEPLGPRQPVEDTRSQRRRPDRGSSTTERSRVARESRAAQIARASDPLARTDTSPLVVVRRDPAPTAVRSVEASPPPPAPPPPPEPQPSISIVGRELPPAGSSPSLSAGPAPGFDLARVSGVGGAQPAPSIVLPEPVPAAPEPVSVADAFADFTLSPSPPAPGASGAVDITAIEVRREIELPPEPAKPVKPAHPSRHWVQVATGKDLKALAFDWRRFGRKAPELLAKRSAFTTPWGESRRLLTGPFESDKAARQLVAELKAAGLDAFSFTSDAGQEIAPLKR